MNNEMNKLFEDLTSETGRVVSAMDKLLYLAQTFTTIASKSRVETITQSLAMKAAKICTAGRRDLDEVDEVLDAFLSIYPKIINKIIEEGQYVQIAKDVNDNTIDLLIADLVIKYDPKDYDI